MTFMVDTYLQQGQAVLVLFTEVGIDVFQISRAPSLEVNHMAEHPSLAVSV